MRLALLPANLDFSNWNIRQAARNASSLTLQNQQLKILQASVESGQVALINHMTGFATATQVATSSDSSLQSSSIEDVKDNRTAIRRSRHGKSRRFRVSLPRWLVGRVWELGLHECDNVWTLQLAPMNVRPARTYVFDFVRAGDVEAVRKLIGSRQLSVQDRVFTDTWEDPITLLEVIFLLEGIS